VEGDNRKMTIVKDTYRDVNAGVRFKTRNGQVINATTISIGHRYIRGVVEGGDGAEYIWNLDHAVRNHGLHFDVAYVYSRTLPGRVLGHNFIDADLDIVEML
jgi:hypothetical protein